MLCFYSTHFHCIWKRVGGKFLTKYLCCNLVFIDKQILLQIVN
jgi:hypothetical protein